MDENSNNKRRDFLQLSTISIGALGTAAFIWPFLSSMNPAEYTLALGTTEVDVIKPDNPVISDEEQKYLIDVVNNYFFTQISKGDIVETYSGIRPLIEDYKEASKVTRDYIFDLNIQNKN